MIECGYNRTFEITAQCVGKEFKGNGTKIALSSSVMLDVDLSGKVSALIYHADGFGTNHALVE